MQTLILDYATWRCGGEGDHRVGQGNTALRNDEGFMCCLGQFSKQIDPSLRDGDILGISGPGELSDHPISHLSVKEDNSCFGVISTLYTDEMIKINDNEYIDTKERIKRIKERSLQEGLIVEVINLPDEL